MRKKCYICLPISGRENDAIERANIAAQEVEVKYGFEAITPMDINGESQETLDDPKRPIEWFMGRDIEALIGKCDAIYICEGWENSRGCRVEVECAKQYGKEIFYECMPLSMTMLDWLFYLKFATKTEMLANRKNRESIRRNYNNYMTTSLKLLGMSDKTLKSFYIKYMY